MSELSDLIPCEDVEWTNLDNYAGTGINIEKRPYFYKVITKGGTTKLLVISATKSDTKMQATNYMRLDKNGFQKLVEVGNKVFNIQK